MTKLNLDPNDFEKFLVPQSVVIIQAGTFQKNNMIKSIMFEEGSKLKVIGEFSFFDMNNLEYLLIPKSVKYIEKNAFENCSNLKKIVFEEGSRPILLEEYSFSRLYSL